MDPDQLQAELRALLVPYEDVLERAEIYGVEVLRRPGAKAHEWFAGVRPGTGSAKLMLLPIHEHPELLDDVSPAPAEAANRCVPVHVSIRGRRAPAGAGAAGRTQLRYLCRHTAGGGTMSQATATPDLATVHDRLKAILAPYRGQLKVAQDTPGGMTLELPGYEGQPWGYVAGTRLGKRYVSYYLMGVYGDPGLMDGMSPELKRRMQGKSCFNFARVDEPLFDELATLTRESIARQPKLVEEALAARARKR